MNFISNLRYTNLPSKVGTHVSPHVPLQFCAREWEKMDDRILFYGNWMSPPELEKDKSTKIIGMYLRTYTQIDISFYENIWMIFIWLIEDENKNCSRKNLDTHTKREIIQPRIDIVDKQPSRKKMKM